MIPKIIHYCWFGGSELSDESKANISEWKNLNPEWEIILWNETNTPFGENYIKAAFEEKNWANMSNFLRLYVLKDYGGVYLDTDVKLVKALDTFRKDKCFFGFEEGDESSNIFWVNNAICGSEKAHPFILECYDKLLKLYDGTEMANISGPQLTTEVLKSSRGLNKYGYQHLEDIVIYPKEFFYPIHYTEVYKLANFQEHIFTETAAIHIWARTWLNRDSLLYIIDDLYRLNYQYQKQITEQSSMIEILKREKDISLSSIPATDLAQQKVLVRLQRIADEQYFSKTLMEEFQQSIHKLNDKLKRKSGELEFLDEQHQKNLALNINLSTSIVNANTLIYTLEAEIKKEKDTNLLIRNENDNAAKTINDQQLVLADYSQTILENKKEIEALTDEIAKQQNNNLLTRKDYENSVKTINNQQLILTDYSRIIYDNKDEIKLLKDEIEQAKKIQKT